MVRCPNHEGSRIPQLAVVQPQEGLQRCACADCRRDHAAAVVDCAYYSESRMRDTGCPGTISSFLAASCSALSARRQALQTERLWLQHALQASGKAHLRVQFMSWMW